MVAKGTMETSAKVQKASLDVLLLAVMVLPASSAAAADDLAYSSWGLKEKLREACVYSAAATKAN